MNKTKENQSNICAPVLPFNTQCIVSTGDHGKFHFLLNVQKFAVGRVECFIWENLDYTNYIIVTISLANCV